MKILVLLLLFICLVSLKVVYAQDILLSTEQSEYYFKIGEKAIIPIEINSTYEKQISGLLQYTITQQINQGNVQFSNSNTEAKSLVINEDNQKNKIQSSSQPNTQSKQQDLFSQQEQQMEQRLNELLGNQQDLFSQQEQQMEQKIGRAS